MFLNPIGLPNLTSKLTNELYNSHWKRMVDWWNDHDNGVRVWTTLSFGVVVTSTAVSYSVISTDQVILVDSTSAIRTITLPTAVGIKGKLYTVKDWKGQSATNNITIATTSSQTIDGASTVTMSTNYQTVRVVSDGSNWSVI